MLADPEMAKRVLTRVQRLSSKYGTRLDIRDGVGVIEAARRAQ
jgi:hypothetical protein